MRVEGGGWRERSSKVVFVLLSAGSPYRMHNDWEIKATAGYSSSKMRGL